MVEEKKVVKFGGSSLASGAQFVKVKGIVDADEARRYVVPSAPGKRSSSDHKITDLLYMCQQLASHGLNFDEVFHLISDRYIGIRDELNLDVNIESILEQVKTRIRDGASKDYAASRGEYINGILLAAYLDFPFVDAVEVIRFKDNGDFDEHTTEKLVHSILGSVERAVVPGFYGAKVNGEIVTFSRGGSDITGSILTNGIQASLYENYTDVSGFLMADPKLVDNPRPMDLVTYRELRELSYMGAPVLHEEAIFPVRKRGIPIQIKNTNEPDAPGTLIVHDQWNQVKEGTITGISGKKDFTVISVEKTLMNNEHGFFRKLISVFETNDVSIEHMPSSIDSISVIVPDADLKGKQQKVIEEIKIYCNPDTIYSNPGMALLAVVGRGMVKTKGISAKIFHALASKGVNIRMISQGSSEINIIIGIENRDFEEAIKAIYEAFQ
ncbi:MAG: aspartate kinase [Tissierellia bacterium]|nr:aspartate kinase [Tissierellia bacterium]